MSEDTELAPELLAAARTPISEIMTHGVVTVRPDDTVEELADMFLNRGLSRAPVVDDEGRLIGIVSKTDLVIDQHQRGDTEVDQRGAGGSGRHVHEVGNLVREVMTPVVFTLPETTMIGEAARRMVEDNVHAVPVTSEDGELIGILSATDIVAWVGGLQYEERAAPSPL